MALSFEEIQIIISNEETQMIFQEIKNKYGIELSILNLLTWGGQGLIFKTQDRITNEKIIIKIPIYSSNKNRAIIEHTLLKEIQIYEYTTKNHTSCIPSLVTFSEKGKYLIHSYIEGENLREYIKKHANISNKLIQLEWRMATELFNIFHNHSPSYILRDFKEKNIIITANDNLFFLDFGSVRQEFSTASLVNKKNRLGTNAFLHWPLEQLVDLKYGNSRKSDYFSFGVMLYFTLFGKYPFTNNEQNYECALKTRKNRYNKLLEQLQNCYDNHVIEEIVFEILVCTLNPDFEKRTFIDYDDSYFSKTLKD